MLIVSSKIYPFMIDNGYVVYNISNLGMYKDIPKLNILPSHEYVYSWMGNPEAEYQMDQQYANLLMTNNAMFMQFMRIIRDLYYGNNVVLLVYHEIEVFDPLTESLCKFIQQRYGYNYQLINTVYDFNPNDASSFSVGGIQNFDIDNNRYLSLIQLSNPEFFANENISAENGYIV